jgi:hypothetical protein
MYRAHSRVDILRITERPLADKMHRDKVDKFYDPGIFTCADKYEACVMALIYIYSSARAHVPTWRLFG